MSYIEEYRRLRQQVRNYAAGERTARGPACGGMHDTTVERWRRAELRMAKLENYFERRGIAAFG